MKTEVEIFSLPLSVSVAIAPYQDNAVVPYHLERVLEIDTFMMWLGITIAVVLAVAGSLKIQRRLKSQRGRTNREVAEAFVDARDREQARLDESGSLEPASEPEPIAHAAAEKPAEKPARDAPPATKTDYEYLEALLAEARYEEADRVTWRIILQLAHAEKRGYLEIDDLDDLPAEALRNLDRCWQACSDGRWGLARQAKMFRECESNYSELGKETGWMIDGVWLDVSHSIYDLDRAPDGHLPQELWRNLQAMFGSFGLSLCIDTFLVREPLPSMARELPETSQPETESGSKFQSEPNEASS